jgi:4-alpha-glucanotransferase
MSLDPGSVNVSPFLPDYRASGILLHVTSLASPYGIGDLGPTAFSWIDRLAQTGQRWWQMLPLGPTGYGNSPYQPISSFAGSELLISPEWLIEDELLRAGDCVAPAFPQDKIDFDAVIPFKQGLLQKAWANFKGGVRADLRPVFERFRADQADWLENYALFRTLKARFGGAYYLEWPAEFVRRDAATLDRVRREEADQIDRICFEQFLLHRQSTRLKEYAHKKGLSLVGDLPFFVSPDSSDVWAHPEFFLLDEEHRPRVVAGVPPDYFSADGQLWGNPIYDWETLRQSDYRWCISRLRALLAHVDVIRLDHFRAFMEAWHVPAGAATARIGKWIAGPGAAILGKVQRELGSLPFLAEDLGFITPDVYAVRDEFHLPGMRVLQFAFDGKSDNPHLPQNYDHNTVVYTGTHDNATTRTWFDELPEDERKILRSDRNLPAAESREISPLLMEAAWSSRAALSIAPLQDVLNLGAEARMNVPGRAEGNWGWRCTQEMLSDRAFDWLRELTKNSNRLEPASTTSGKASVLEAVATT